MQMIVGFDEIKQNKVDAVMLRLIGKVWGNHTKDSNAKVIVINPQDKIEASIAFREVKKFLV